ncbi:acetolactate synthase large subunit [Marinifilum caeruleilacunae]|uniref:Acetolactate synthase large subunit n=1 Tax=Marinifilum caeruleilacunae TaxID=2499076 RepID=A0ABX1WUH9_9BACT|nr:acetolactate synthase large subunit [Marinifilum caeruleilacunae]NOU59755.1 acetolactate synthase large subunit [Marinifilum caeruleilacunae]
MKASDLFVKALENEGVEYIFGIPGEENLDILDSLKDSKIKLILTRHEQAAGFMAATYGRLTGKPGVCLATLGPGATNFVTASAYAQLGAMPMMMITGQKPIKKSKQGRFQILDVVDMMRPITKYTRQIVNGNNIPAMVREAFRIAVEERPGAVHLELPEDIAAEEIDASLFETNPIRRANPEVKSLEMAVDMIQNAKRPLLLIGAGANRKRTSKALRDFIEKTGIYFFNTQMGKGVVDERHSLYLGTAALSDHDYLHCALERADLIVNVGHDVIEKPPFFMEQGGKKVIHVNFFAAQVDDVYFPQLNVVGDIAFSIKELTRMITVQNHWDFDYFCRIKIEVDQHIKSNSESAQFPILPQYLVSEVRKALPDDGILTLDNGVYKIWFARNFPAYHANTLLLDNALATMGAGFPSAMAAKMVYPERAVVSVCGDGGFMMNSQELETAVRLGLHVVIVILNDSAYGMIKWKQAAQKFENFGLDYANPDFVKYAESYGAKGHRVEKSEDFSKILNECLQSKGVHLIDVPVDYSENHKVLNEELYAKTCIL